MEKSIILQHVSPEKLTQLIQDGVKSQLNDFKKEFSNSITNVLLTRDETCKYLQIDSSTLWHWTNKGKVIAYGIGSRRYYKKEELLKCLIPLKK